MGQPCNQESSIKLTHPPCTIIYTGNCPTPAAALVKWDSPETREGVLTLQLMGNASHRVEKQFSATDHVKARYVVSVSEGGCCPVGALFREMGQ